MIKDCSKIWEELFVVNDPTFELTYFGKDEDIPIVVVKNILKYPDKVREFLSNGYWWKNGFSEEYARPGKSFEFGGNKKLYVSKLIDYFESFFGVEYIHLLDLYGNCFNGNMDLPNVSSVFPHVDSWPEDKEYDLYLEGKLDVIESIKPDIAFNINLTNSDNVNTSIWSFNNKKSIFDLNREDFNYYESFSEDMENKFAKNTKWFQLDSSYGPYKCEDIIPIEYNSMILYPSFYWHSAYVESEWFNDSDRITLTGFMGIDPNNMNFKKENLKNVYSVWEFFGLNKIYGLNQ